MSRAATLGLIAGAVAALCGCSATVSPAPTPSPSSELASIDLDQLRGNLECDQELEYADDVFNYRGMVGSLCIAGQSYVHLRVYESGSAMHQAVGDWEPPLSNSVRLIVGKDWIAYGTVDMIEQVQASPQQFIEINSSADLPVAQADDEIAFKNSCVSLVTGTVASIVGGADREQSINDLEQHALEGVAPVMNSFIDAVATEPLDKDSPIALEQLESNMSFHVGSVKTYCQEAWEESK